MDHPCSIVSVVGFLLASVVAGIVFAIRKQTDMMLATQNKEMDCR